jgi:general secretion pathway protein H
MRHARAFTLLEVLVVIAVIGVIVAVSIPSIAKQSPERQVLAQAERLKQIIDLMCENAELDGLVLGLGLARNRYGVLLPPSAGNDPETQEKPPWESPKNRAVFAPFTLPEGMQMTLTIGLNNETVSLTDKLPNEPQLPCAGSSELPEFRLRLQLGDDENAIRHTLIPQPARIDQVSNFAVMIEANSTRN